MLNVVLLTNSHLLALTADAQEADTRTDREAMIDQFIQWQLIRQAAQKDGYGSRADIVGLGEKDKANKEVDLYIRELAIPTPLEESSVKARHDQLTAEMGPYDYRVNVISLDREAAAP